MFDRVGERSLHDAVDGDTGALSHRVIECIVAPIVEVDLSAAGPQPVDQSYDIVHVPQRFERRNTIVFIVEQPEHAIEIGQGRPAHALDVPERADGAAVVGGQAADTRLHHRHVDCVTENYRYTL